MPKRLYKVKYKKIRSEIDLAELLEMTWNKAKIKKN